MRLRNQHSSAVIIVRTYFLIDIARLPGEGNTTFVRRYGFIEHEEGIDELCGGLAVSFCHLAYEICRHKV